MCGRFSRGQEEMEFASRFAQDVVRSRTQPRYNIAPSQSVAVLALERQRLVEREMRWGWSPAWSRRLLINAQAETVMTKPTFKQAFTERRCLIPADGFYEWLTEGGEKSPVRFVLKSGEPFCFAGLWERCPKGTRAEDLFADDIPDEPAVGEVVESVLILTTAANAIVRAVHSRMPVILQPSHYDWWLEGGSLAEMAMAHPRNGELEWYRVNPVVNNPRVDDVKCIARVDQPRGG